MRRILLDENIPFGLRKLLADHDVSHATELGWEGLSNGSLIAAAEREGFEILLTADRNLRYQQNLPTAILLSLYWEQIAGERCARSSSSSPTHWTALCPVQSARSTLS